MPLSDELREKNNEIEKKKQNSNFETIRQSVLRFAESIKPTNPNLAFSLQSANCTRGYDNCIIFEVNNSLSEQDIERNKQKIMAFVKQDVGSDDFFIQVKCAVYRYCSVKTLNKVAKVNAHLAAILSAGR